MRADVEAGLRIPTPVKCHHGALGPATTGPRQEHVKPLRGSLACGNHQKPPGKDPGDGAVRREDSSFLTSGTASSRVRGDSSKRRSPAVPGYVFFRARAEQGVLTNWSSRITEVIAVSDQCAMARELRDLHTALSLNVEAAPCPFRQQDLPVRVRSGPLQGLRGVIPNPHVRDQLVLQIRNLGLAAAIEFDGNLLEQVDRSA